MLSDRITTLFSLLQCNNTQIARFAGCSSGNISKLKTGNREPKPTSRSITAFAEGVYGYADYENMLPMLAELCGAADTGRESLIPALIGWLYETEAVSPPDSAVTPKSKRTRAFQRQRFGEKLDRAMSLLELSNGQLAALLNIDVSLVSRYRTGVYSPHGNAQLSERLCGILLARAKKNGQLDGFAKLCGAEAGSLDADAVAAWLYNSLPEEDSAAMAQRILRSLDDFIPGEGLPTGLPEVPKVPVASCYMGTEGLRSAVIRFLTDAAREGGELLLYSDEPMNWMSGDQGYFALWASLMVKCVNSGVRIRIIHNVDREGEEMANAIKGWFPLYMSGMIEPYVFRRDRAPRFYHTVFLRPGNACVYVSFPAGSGEDRWYEYITDPERLDLLEREYTAMLSAASPFLKIYTAGMREEFHRMRISAPGARDYLLSEFPIVTMPEELLARMLTRCQVPEDKKKTALAHYRDLRSQFEEVLRENSINIILCLREKTEDQGSYINSALSLTEFTVDYTQEEYAEHVAAVIELVERERNFHLTLLPLSPFQDIQIVTRKDAVIVLRCREPYTAFVFLNPNLRQSVSAYFSTLVDQYAADRRTVIEALKELQ